MQADKQTVTRLINTAKGQLNGILKMIEEERYCMDISNQVLACRAVLSKINREILTAHLEACVKDALTTEQAEEKIEELIAVVEKLT